MTNKVIGPRWCSALPTVNHASWTCVVDVGNQIFEQQARPFGKHFFSSYEFTTIFPFHPVNQITRGVGDIWKKKYLEKESKSKGPKSKSNNITEVYVQQTWIASPMGLATSFAMGTAFGATPDMLTCFSRYSKTNFGHISKATVAGTTSDGNESFWRIKNSWEPFKRTSWNSQKWTNS